MQSDETALILDKLLGHGKDRKGNRIYFCPFCNHYKPKLEVHLTTGYYNCWACPVSGKSIFTLLKRLNATKDYYDKLSEFGSHKFTKTDTATQHTKVVLPNEFIPLTTKSKLLFERQHVINYLKNRGLSNADILRYNIGYCQDGLYSQRLIVPSYDALCELNYFISRTYRNDDSVYSPYMNPDYNKNIIGFEMFINWDMPIFICEGAFDAFAIKHNAIPLFGKRINDLLKQRIIENDVEDIYICLDTDAKKEALELCRLFMSQGRNVYFVELDGKDPSKLGYAKMWQLIRATQKLTFSSLIKYKLKQ